MNRFVDAPDTITAFYNSTVYFTINTNSEQQIPEFPSWTPLPILLAAIMAVTFVYKRNLRNTTQ